MILIIAFLLCQSVFCFLFVLSLTPYEVIAGICNTRWIPQPLMSLACISFYLCTLSSIDWPLRLFLILFKSIHVFVHVRVIQGCPAGVSARSNLRPSPLFSGLPVTVPHSMANPCPGPAATEGPVNITVLLRRAGAGTRIEQIKVEADATAYMHNSTSKRLLQEFVLYDGPYP